MSIASLALFDFLCSEIGITSEMGRGYFVMCSRTQASKTDFVNIFIQQNSTLGKIETL